MAGQPGARGALNLAGAFVSAAMGLALVAVAVVLAAEWIRRDMVPWSQVGFMFWWIAPLLALIGVAVLAVAVSLTRDWRRSRTG